MTASEYILDTWAWWEVLAGTDAGRAISRRFLARSSTSTLAMAELSAKLANLGQDDRIDAVMDAIRGASRVVPVTEQDAVAAGPLRRELRQARPAASLADALMLATARRLQCALVSNDACFQGQADVVRLKVAPPARQRA